MWLRIATGTYILQCNRASYNQFESDATCNLCGKSDETLTHFLLECETLQSCRQPIITEIELACNSLCTTLGTSTLGVELVKLIIDTSSVLNVYPEVEISFLQEIQFHGARLCYSLHCQRFKLLGLVPKCKRKNKRRIGSIHGSSYVCYQEFLVPLLQEEVRLRRRNLQYTVTVTDHF